MAMMRERNETAMAEELAVATALLQKSNVHVRSQGPGAGSGVIWRPDGLIITNAHVARGPRATVELWDGGTLEAEVTARDPRLDLAALQVNATGLPAAAIADSTALRVGQLVTAVGNPLGMSGALTLGIIHAITRDESPDQRTWVQADIELLPGNSGGALADAEGRVIGINSMVAGGLGLAVPSDSVLRFLGRDDRRAQLGFTLQPVVVSSRRLQSAGLLVMEVTPGSSADSSNIIIGDIVAALNGETFEDPRRFLSALGDLSANSNIRLGVIRGGDRITRDVALGSSHESEGAAA